MKRCCHVVLVVLLVFGLFSAFGQKGWAADIKLEMWDDMTREGESKIIDALASEFEQQNNCTVQRTSRPLEDSKTAVMAAVRSGKVADIIIANNGETMMGPLVRGGYLVPLDKYAEQFGWLKRLFSPDLLTRNRYSADGTVFGIGNLYAICSSGEIVGVFYNKAIFKKLGLTIPTSLKEFEATLEKIKAAGETPLTFGNKDRWPIFHVYGEVEHALVSAYEGRQYLDKMIMNWADDGNWESKSTIEGAQIVQDWVKKGYFTQGFAGIGYDDSVAMFAAGQGAMMIAGNWVLDVLNASALPLGFFPFPPVDPAKGMSLQVGGVRTPYGISMASTHQELAAKLLDHIFVSKEAQKRFVEEKLLPGAVPVDLSSIQTGTLYYDVMKAWNDVNATNNVGHYLDWTTPTFFDTLAVASQEMLALKLTPEEFAAKLQADYTQWLKDKPKPGK
jgi:raffinose/stachyose/melibiose transport system substrate-binding protein